ncbi:MAG: YkgJ family cysteine cluster protein [Bdellovibrionales bacterium]|nr:YkgJ family cysteine cluster protein [Bdellovibrionales bacterium]
MSTNSLNQSHLSHKAAQILAELENISEEFSRFQESSNLSCIEGCGRCCFKSDIYCSPYELLPMALELLEKGEAQKYYNYLTTKIEASDKCIFLNVTNADQFQGLCSNYKFRPLVCRTFGVSARHEKNNDVSFSVCRPLKAEKQNAVLRLNSMSPNIAFIDHCKTRLSAIDPQLSEIELPMNESLKIILEKVLLYSSFN